ncbi:SGNH/GDSL hydrolase family protein [Brucella anthropi]|uniref:SGNH/GDSL hydrolase family protein n=1 Tax=Brucella anthropi TaxID=529 RepID=UPI00124E229D|nr:SGNH/GDSL hydrolase family protein [Brucella anthropi]KAB2725666.1 SGNH/GDSL hydrolase family protein [Brucella anthropi]KAB2742977.1 SGNH/GDSL hydrolase family protein [Brucella anthropi]KAB2803798.1 SGNH/GDSL hydrolase family protein [Brucella anthropi]
MVTITASTREAFYNPVVPTTDFPVNFPIFGKNVGEFPASDLQVEINNEIRTDFIVIGDFIEGISTNAIVRMNSAVTGFVTVRGKRSPRRTDQYINGGALRIPDHNYSLNRLEAEMQEVRRDGDRNSEKLEGFVADVTDLTQRAENAANSAEQSEELAGTSKDLAVAAKEAAESAAGANLAMADSVNAAQAISFPPSVNYVRAAGGLAAGDNAGGLYKQEASEPFHFHKFQSNDGAWWSGVEEDDRLRSLAVSMFNGGRVTIDCFGDSTMVGVDVTNPPTYIAATPAPAKLQLFLRDYYANGNIQVNNRAFSGTRTINMLEGSDGSGQTFEARIAASGAQIVYCNHGINDCQNTPPTPIGDYKANLYEIVRIIRAYGKIPVLMTPNLISPVAPLGTTDKSERLKSYAEVVREVCRTARVALVDAFEQVSQLLTCGNYTVQQILPDGIHPTQIGYSYIGQLMATPYVYPYQGVSAEGEIVSVANPVAICTPFNEPTEAKNSRAGMQLVSTADNVAKSIRALIKIDRAGLDLYVGYPIWAFAVTSAGIALNQVTLGSISQYHDGNYGSRYIQDHEVCVARNIPPGLHMVTISAAAQAASIALSYLRVKKAKTVEKRLANGSPFLLTRKNIMDQATLTVSNGSANGIVLTDTIQFDRFLAGFDFSFTAQLAKGEAVCVFGEWAADASSGTAVMALGVGADETTGYLTIFQATGDGTYNKTPLTSVDITLQEREFRIVMGQGSGSALTVYLDGGPYGPTTIIAPFLGGFFGLRRSGNGTMNVKNLQILK